MHFRPWKLSDLDDLCNYANNPKIANYLSDRFPNPYPRETGEWFVNYTCAPENKDRFRVIEIRGEFGGAIGLHPDEDIFRLNSEIGYWIAEPFWGNGYGTKAVKKIVNHGFTNFDFTRIYARVFKSNPPSIKVLEKSGF